MVRKFEVFHISSFCNTAFAESQVADKSAVTVLTLMICSAATVNEEGNKDYYLLKPITDNVSYYIYGSWSSGEAYKEHLKSDHTKKLLEFDFKKGVVFTIQPLLIVD